MISVAELLEDFGRPAVAAEPAATGPTIDEATLEARRVDAYEDGYRAGWEDSAKAQTADRAALTSTLAQSLGDLSFTYQEAYGAMMAAVSPLLEDMVAKLLPDLARQTLGAHVVEQLRQRAADIAGLEVEIAVSSGCADAVAPLLEGEFTFPIRLVEDDTLAPEQADIRFAETESQIDLSDVLSAFTAVVEGFAEDTRRKIANG